MSMGDTDILVGEFGGEIVGGVVIVFEDGQHKEAARCVEGTWVTADEFKQRIADLPPAAPAKGGKKPNAPVDE